MTRDVRGVPVYQELRRLVTQAIDDGVYYQDAMRDYCDVRSADRSPEVFLGVIDTRGMTPQEIRLEEKLLAGRLRHMPRSTWAILHQRGTHGDYFAPKISAGGGVLGSTHNYYTGHSPQVGVDTKPCTFASVYRDMLGMEVYLVRGIIQQEHRLAADLAAMVGFTKGETFRNVTWGSMRTFSTLVVTEIDTTIGKVRLTGTKRGSRRRWECTAGAAELATMVGKTSTGRVVQPNPYPVFVTSRVVV